MRIDKAILSYLLNITQKDAKLKIQSCIQKHGLSNKTCSIKSSQLDLLSNHVQYDIDFAIKNIQKSYTKSFGTLDWILNYPSHLIVRKYRKDKISNEFYNTHPEVIRLPPVLRKILTTEQKQLIIEKWRKRYEFEVKNYQIQFI